LQSSEELGQSRLVRAWNTFAGVAPFGEFVGNDHSAAIQFQRLRRGYVLFQSPTLFTGSNFWCDASSDGGCSSEPVAETINVKPDVNQFTSVSGTHVIASVPEPSTLSFLSLGMAAVIGFRNSAPRAGFDWQHLRQARP
jgi:hypothetical protein